MDKLKPILAQKFWILSGLCLILAVTGWWLSTAGIAAEIIARKDTLKKAYDSIPQPGPNDNWTKRVKEFNKDEEHKVTQTGDFLWDNQLKWMTWPEEVQAGVEAAIKKGGYRSEIDAETRGEYRYVYDRELSELLAIVEPLNDEGNGKIQASLDLIPNLGWGQSQNPVGNKEMWDTQEDIWLYQALFTAIANINNQYGSKSLVDSKIKEIVKLELRGGTPGGGGKAGAPGAPSPAPGGPAPGGVDMMKSMSGASPGGMMGGGGAAMTASFDPSEQLGSDTDTSAPASGAQAKSSPAVGGVDMMKAMAGGGGSSAAGPRKRYIEETDRYKTRGFYMELVMDHRELPEFLSELSDSGWPLRVIRVQSVDRDLSEINSDVVGKGPGALTGGGTGGGGANVEMMKKMMAGGGKALPRGGADDDDGGPVAPRLALPKGGVDGGASSDGAVDLQVAMSDPYLVNVALSGIITLYLPPGPPAGTPPGTPGVPATNPAGTPPPATTLPAATTPAATTPGAATPPGGTPAATTPAGIPAATAPGATSAAAPAAVGTPPAAPATPADKAASPPAEKAATEKPAGEPAATKPPAPAPAPTAPAPAGTPAKPEEAKKT